MNQYKDNTYYDDYFSNLNDFKLTEPFVIVQDKNKKHYIGKIDACNFAHPLVIRVEIPVTFPHHKLIFYTDSIYGYPHLIPNIANGGKDSWFCLNTPFAETTEGQLNEELNRLRGWITRFNSEQLPARIEDEKDRKALNKQVVYIWENPDELYEYHKESNVTFIGDFAYKPEFTNKGNKGYFNCVHNASNNIYIINDNKKRKSSIPYIIVDDEPENLQDFESLRKQFQWNNDTCDFLLSSLHYSKFIVTDYNVGTIFKFIPKVENKENAKEIIEEKIKTLYIKEDHQQIVKSSINEILKEISTSDQENNSLVEFQDGPLEGESKEDYYNRLREEEKEDFYNRHSHEIFTYFLLGIKYDNKIRWRVLNTCQFYIEQNLTKYDLGVTNINIYDLASWYLNSSTPRLITDFEYFGRGKMKESLVNKKIALIGLGAIGSNIAVSLTRSGVSTFGLWDNDIIEPGNICRSTYNVKDFGESKILAIKEQIKSINPYAKVNFNGCWSDDPEYNIPIEYTGGDLYSNINYKSQDDVIKELKDYDLIIDCTANNELLHYLSYAVPDKELVSLCITNQAADLLMVSNADGNAFDLRKFYLSKIEQDTKNFYVEGNGCYSPKFKALNCDVTTLVNLAVREINATIGNNQPIHTTTWSYDRRGVVADRMSRYKLKDGDIRLYVSSESLLDAEDIKDVAAEPLGYLLGGYGRDGRDIMITHFVGSSGAESKLHDVYETSGGLIDYIGDMCYASDEEGTFKENVLPRLRYKANNEEINTNNPLLAVRTPNGNIMFYLYINDEMVPFEKEY